MSNSFMRRLAILDVLDASSESLAVSDIIERLEDHHFDAGINEPAKIRTVQRDLVFLFNESGLHVDQETDGNQKRWFRVNSQSSNSSKAPSLTPSNAAFALELTKKHLNRLLPRQSKQALKPYFEDSERALAKLQQGTLKNLKRTAERIEYAQRGFALITDSSVQNFSVETLERIYDAIASKKRIAFKYNGKRKDSAGKEYDVSPIAIMIKEPKSYLLGVKESKFQPDKPLEQQLQQFVLNRISDLYINNKTSRDNDSFDYKKYLSEGHADPTKGNDDKLYNLKLRLLVKDENHSLLRDLREYKLHKDQEISLEKKTGFFLLKAPVRRTHAFYEWLLGRGADVEVIQPKVIRDDITELVSKLGKLYK